MLNKEDEQLVKQGEKIGIALKKKQHIVDLLMNSVTANVKNVNLIKQRFLEVCSVAGEPVPECVLNFNDPDDNMMNIYLVASSIYNGSIRE